MNLAEALPEEINRVRALQGVYALRQRMVGVNAEPAIAFMEVSIQNAVRASTTGDVIQILRAYEDLRGYE